MDKIKPLFKLTAYIVTFIVCECFLHYLQSILVIGLVPSVTLRVMETISAFGAVIEVFEIATGLEIKEKLREVFEQLWKKTTQKYFNGQKIEKSKRSLQ